MPIGPAALFVVHATGGLPSVWRAISPLTLGRLARMAGDDDSMRLARGPIGERRLERARRIVDLAWRDLPGQHRLLLENIGASRWQVLDRPLGNSVNDLLISAGYAQLLPAGRVSLDRALGMWIERLHLVLIDAGHSVLADLDDQTFELMLVRTAWHEWGHALSVVRAEHDDVAAGERLLDLAPDGVREFIRRAGYRRSEYTHELIAEIYALLMSRRRRGHTGQPPWLADEIYRLVRRVSGWSE